MNSTIWNSLEIAKLLASLLMPIVVAWLAYSFNRNIKRVEQANEERNRLAALKREEKLQQLERRYEPHIEFTIDCQFFGPQQGYYAAEFVIGTSNKSLIRHQFNKIMLRVRAIGRDQPLNQLPKYPERLEFQSKLFETDVKPPNWNYIFVEPGVSQEITFITRVPQDIRFITARARFEYDKYTPHSIERMFEVAASRGVQA